jgi:hypothetical protein
MAAPASVLVPETPLTGTVDIAVDMIAPDTPGIYKGFWQMRSPSGARFGERVYVMIEVPASEDTSPEDPLAPPASETPSPSAPSTGAGNFHIINATGDRLEVAFDGDQTFYFVLGNYDNTVEIAPGGYVYSFVSCGHLWAGGDRRQMDRITVEPGVMYEVSCSCQPVHQWDKPKRIIDMWLWCSVYP